MFHQLFTSVPYVTLYLADGRVRPGLLGGILGSLGSPLVLLVLRRGTLASALPLFGGGFAGGLKNTRCRGFSRVFRGLNLQNSGGSSSLRLHRYLRGFLRRPIRTRRLHFLRASMQRGFPGDCWGNRWCSPLPSSSPWWASWTPSSWDT